MRPVGLIIYHIFHRPVLRKGRKITQAAHLNKNRNSQLGTQFVYKVDSSLRFYLFLQLIAPRVMFSVCLHHSVFDIFVNKSAQSTLCQTCSLGLSLARANTYLFLEANMKLFDFFELAAHSISVWFTEFLNFIYWKVTTGEHYLPHLCVCFCDFRLLCYQPRWQNKIPGRNVK